jgi:hypothetical protein
MGAKMSAWIERENQKAQVRHALFYAADETARLKKEAKKQDEQNRIAEARRQYNQQVHDAWLKEQRSKEYDKYLAQKEESDLEAYWDARRRNEDRVYRLH